MVDRVRIKVWDGMKYKESRQWSCSRLGPVKVSGGVGMYGGSHLPCTRPGTAGTAPPATEEVWGGVGKYGGSHLPCVRPGAEGTAPPATSWSHPGGQSQTWGEVWGGVCVCGWGGTSLASRGSSEPWGEVGVTAFRKIAPCPAAPLPLRSAFPHILSPPFLPSSPLLSRLTSPDPLGPCPGCTEMESSFPACPLSPHFS